MSSATSALERLLEVFDRMEIGYHVGGSVASSTHGMPRTTLDVDIVVDLKSEQIDPFAEQLAGEFYIDPDHMREAFSRGRAANLIHLKTAWKFDLFPLASDEYSQTAFRRRVFREVRPDGRNAVECAVSTPEDTILRKLEWYRAGGEVSERQWTDLRGITSALHGRLDLDYLHRWARELHVADLLEALISE
jgi:hypothetical protein